MLTKVLLLLAAGTVPGVFVEAAPLSSLIPQADAIVLGTETAPVNLGGPVTFQLTVERVFSGALGEGATITVVCNLGSLRLRWAGSPSYRGIWFLHRGTGGDWECIPAGVRGNAAFLTDLSLPVGSGALPSQLAYDPAATALPDQLVLEMGASQPPDPSLILNVTDGMNSPAVLQMFRYLAGSQPADLALIGSAGLIQRGDVPGLLQAEKLLANADAGNAGAGQAISAIATGFRTPEPAAVASLGRMASSSESSSQLQFAAAMALSAIHSIDAVPWLAALLDSSSQRVQIYGAQGLSFFANGVGVPGAETTPGSTYLNQWQPSSYRTAETQQHIGYTRGQPEPFLDFWRGWWQQHPELHAQH